MKLAELLEVAMEESFCVSTSDFGVEFKANATGETLLRNMNEEMKSAEVKKVETAGGWLLVDVGKERKE